MLKEYRTRDVFGVSIGGADGEGEYSLEGQVLVYILKKWDDDAEDWRLSIWDWVVLRDGFTLVRDGGEPELIGQDFLTHDMQERVECLLEQLLS